MDSGTEASLGKKRFRNGEIRATDFPQLLRVFVFLDENSRSVPGLDTVSVGRNLPRQPKRTYNRPRYQIIEEFKKLHPECGFQK